MRFPYLALPSRRPIPPLGGSQVRHRPEIPVHIMGPNGSRLFGPNIDSGSDDILVPLHLARHLGAERHGTAGFPGWRLMKTTLTVS